MPIYVNNGIANSIVKKRYAFDGTANAEVKKRYAFDGTANHEVYSAETKLFDYGQTVPWQIVTGSGSGQADLNADNMYLWTTSFTQAAVCTQSPIDLTNYTTLTVYVHFSGINGWTNGVFKLATSTSNGLAWDVTATASREYVQSRDEDYYLTITLDISAVNGMNYVILGVNRANISSNTYQVILS